MINPEDMAILYGFSLFETFYVDFRGRIFLLEEHIRRILDSASFFGIDVKFDKYQLQSIVKQHIDENEIVNSILRMTITAGNKSKEIKSVVLFSRRDSIYTPATKAAGCKLCFSDARKNGSSSLLSHKTANYLENYLLLRESASKGFDDMLFLNNDSYITETCKSNIFFIKDKILFTPETKCGLLPGITRKWVIEKAAAKGIQCVEGKFEQSDILNAEEVFVTNSAMGIFYVKEIDGAMISCGKKLFEEKKLSFGKLGEITEFFIAELFLDMESDK